MVSGYESCKEDAEIQFDNILDRLTGCDPSMTDYVLEVPARCATRNGAGSCGCPSEVLERKRCYRFGQVRVRFYMRRMILMSMVRALVYGIN